MSKKLIHTYDYKNKKGEVVHQTLRYEPKTFRQRRTPIASDDAKDVNDGWVYSLAGIVPLLYRLPELLEAGKHELIYLVEGEKDADLLASWGLNVTSVPMGAGKWRPEYARYFRGRWVVVVEDHDAENEKGVRPGEKGAGDIALELIAAKCDKVGILKMRDLWKSAPEGTDISDWARHRGKKVDFETLVYELQHQAIRSRVSMKLAMSEGIKAVDGPRTRISESRFCKRFMVSANLVFCAALFWRWDVRAGVWVGIEDDLVVEKMIRDALEDGGHEAFITQSLISALLKMCRTERFMMPDDLNKGVTGRLCVGNGMLDVNTLEIEPHQPGLRMTTKCPHIFDTSAECPSWMAWLEDRLTDEETRDLVQEMFGYCLVTDLNFHKFFFIYGDGGTGKSTCVNVLEWLIGEGNRISVELTELDDKFVRSQLVGKSLYLCKELTSRSFKHIGLIKSIVGGDPVPVDVKYGKGFTFCPKGRFVMESNVIAATPDSSGGFERRFIQIDFDKKIDRDTMEFGFEKKFKKEMSGILNWALAGYARLRERGRFVHTVKSNQATKDLMKHRAQVQCFIDSGALVGHADGFEGCVKIADIYASFGVWCDTEDVVPFYKERATFMREFMSKMKKWRVHKKRRVTADGNREWVIYGLAIGGGFSSDFSAD